MKEFFGKLIQSSIEKTKRCLYDSGPIYIQKFESSHNRRPTSALFQHTHPELYNFLLTGQPAKKFNVGIIHIDGDGSISRGLVAEGKNPVHILTTLFDAFYAECLKIAEKIKRDPSSDLAKIDFLTSFSRLWASEDFLKSFGLEGFEVFDIDDTDDLKFNSISHRHNEKTYKALHARDQDTPIPMMDRRPAKILLISKQTLLNLLERKQG